MHKGVIILIKAEDRDDALTKVDIFMEEYQNEVWDWYAIGNRWHNTLAPKEKMEEFHKWVKETYKDVFMKDGAYKLNDLENETVRPIIQGKWEELGLRGINPYYSAYGFDVKDTEDDYNAVPLRDCLETVKEWVRDIEEAKRDAWNKMLEAKEEADNNGAYDMSGYWAGIYKDAQYNNFCFDSNVFNADTYEAETIPKEEEINDYWAVMVDMHS
jgi:hypothetical protein